VLRTVGWLLLWVLVLWGSNPYFGWAVAPPKAGAYSHAFAVHNCAPWDGPALNIVMQTRPVKLPIKATQAPAASFPHLKATLLLEHGQLVMRGWIPLNGMDSPSQNGALLWCKGTAQCQTVPARIRIERLTDQSIQGMVQLTAPVPSGLPARQSFRAPVSEFVALCG
jgi:hypothetical protein